MKKLLTILAALAFLASGTVNAQVAEKLTAHRLDRPWTFSSFVAPSGCVSSSVPFFGADVKLTCDGGITYDGTVGGIQQVNKVAPKSDLNSLVNSDVSAPEWIYDETMAYVVGAIKSPTGVVVNRNLVTSQVLHYRGIRAWVCPAGVTSVTFTVRARILPGDASASMRLGIGTSAGLALSPDNSTNFALAADYADYSVAATVVAGTSYTLFLMAKHSTMAGGVTQRFEVASARLVPNAGTGVFAGSFTRYAITPSVVANSYGWTWGVSRRTYEQSTGATVNLTTDASAMAVEYTSDIYTTSATSAKIAMQESGQSASVLAVDAQQVPKMTEVSFVGTGTKSVTVWGGLQTKPASTVLGTRPVAIYVPSTASLTFSRTPPSLVVYGDSIAAGGNCTNPPTEAWPMLLRSYFGGRLAVHGWGYGTLYDDGVDAATRTAFVRKLVSYGAHRYWIAIGTNDYGLNKWTAASFGTAYAGLLDEIHAQDPLAIVYCQTPIVRTSEAANGSGSTLGDYRTAIQDAVSTRRPWAIGVDGPSFLTTASLDDGVHPTTAGHVLYAAAVRAVLGL